MIWAGTLLSRLDDLSHRERGSQQWIWGVIILILLLVVPLIILGMVMIYMQYPEISQAVRSWKPG